MIAALAFLLPLSLGGAISPMMLTEQIVVLGTSGRRTASRYALGAALTLLVIVVLLVFAGGAIELPQEPTLSASLDIGLGVALLAIAAALRLVERHPLHLRRGPGDGKAKRARLSLADHPEAALPFGAFSMATNFTTLALIVVAAKEIAATDVDTLGRVVLVLAVVAICSLPAWAPLATTKLAPRTGDRALETLRGLVDRHSRTAVVVLLAGAGVFLVARGLVGV